AFRPGDPVALLSLLKHPLLGLGLERASVRHAAEIVELVALRGGTGRPDVASLPQLFDARLAEFDHGGNRRPPFWRSRLSVRRIEQARDLLIRLTAALAPLVAFRGEENADLATLVRASVGVLESLGRAADGSLNELYAGDAGEKLAELLR
ncbi:MAG: double-strand break repair protein AddB, partial [Mesorhizobium sp.]